MPLFDDNFQRLARMQNIFGPQNPIGGPNLSSNMPGSPLVMNAADNQAPPEYQPDTRASDMLYQMIQNMPQRNAPGIGRKILASIGGLGGGPQMADQFLYKPYYNQMQDFQARLGPVEKLAGEERMQNANMRQLYASMTKDKTEQAKLDLATRAQGEKERAAQAREDISRRRADAYTFDKEHPDWKAEKLSGQTLKYRNPKDPGQVYDTGLEDNHLSDADKINLQTRGRLSEIAAQGAEARKTETLRETGRQADIASRGAQARATKTTSSASRASALAKDKQLSVSQDAAAYKLARQQYIQDNPSHAKFWNPDGSPTNNAEDDDNYVSAVEDIRRRYNVIKSRTVGKPGTSNVPAKRTGTARVKAPDGRTGTWDFSHGDIPAGYVEIK